METIDFKDGSRAIYELIDTEVRTNCFIYKREIEKFQNLKKLIFYEAKVTSHSGRIDTTKIGLLINVHFENEDLKIIFQALGKWKYDVFIMNTSYIEAIKLTRIRIKEILTSGGKDITRDVLAKFNKTVELEKLNNK